MKLVHTHNCLKALAVAFILIANFLLVTPISAAGNTIVSVSAPAQAVSSGTQFTVNITVQPNAAIAGAQFNLSFNPSLVSINSVTEGNLFKQNGASTYFAPGTINNAAGLVTWVAGVVLGSGQSVSNPGTFAVISMTARADSGTSSLTLSNVILGDINAQSLGVTIVNSQVVINNGTTTTTTITTTTNPTTTTTPTTTTATTTTTPAGVSGGGGSGGIASPTASGANNVTSYINAQGVFSQNINIWSDDTNAVVSIPVGTTGLTAGGASLTQISFTHITTPPAFQVGAGMIDLAYDITPNGITFSPSLTLKFTYYNLPAGTDPNTLQISYYDSTQNAWVTVPSKVDAASNSISAQISHFTPYAVTYGVKPLASATTTAANTKTTTTASATTTTVTSAPTTTTAATLPLTPTSTTTTSHASLSTSINTSLDNTGADQTTPTLSATSLKINTAITPATAADTTTPNGIVTVRMYILAVVIGIAVFLIAFTAVFIWLRHRDLLKKTNDRTQQL